jgi:hypothetical protein
MPTRFIVDLMLAKNRQNSMPSNGKKYTYNA